MRSAPSFLPLLGAIFILLQLGLPTCQVLTCMIVLVMMLSVIRQTLICQPTHPVTTLARSLAWPLLPLLTPVMMSSCLSVRSWQFKNMKSCLFLYFSQQIDEVGIGVDVDGSDAWWQCNGWQCQLDMIIWSGGTNARGRTRAWGLRLERRCVVDLQYRLP